MIWAFIALWAAVTLAMTEFAKKQPDRPAITIACIGWLILGVMAGAAIAH